MTFDSVHPLAANPALTVLQGESDDVFSKLEADDWQQIFSRGEIGVYHDGEAILSQGTSNDSIYFVKIGQVRIERDINGDKLELAALKAGSVFGEMSLLENATASASVVADGETEIVRLDGVMLEQIIQSDPSIGLRFYHSLATSLSRRLRATNKTVQDTYIQLTAREKALAKDTGDDATKEILDVAPALQDLVLFISRATAEDSPGGRQFSDSETRKYRELRSRLDKELEEVDQAVESNQALPIQAY